AVIDEEEDAVTSKQDAFSSDELAAMDAELDQLSNDHAEHSTDDQADATTSKQDAFAIDGIDERCRHHHHQPVTSKQDAFAIAPQHLPKPEEACHACGHEKWVWSPDDQDWMCANRQCITPASWYLPNHRSNLKD